MNARYPLIPLLLFTLAALRLPAAEPNIRKNLETVAQDGAWFTLRIKVEGKRVITSVDGKVVIDYTEPDGWTPPDEMKGRRIARGTLDLQGHDPISEMHYRNIKLRPLPTGESP